MMKARLKRGCGGLALLLAGCATTQPAPPPATGDASWRIANPPGTVRYQLALGEVSSGATAFRRVAPVYPPSVLASCPAPQELPVQLIIDTHGAVGEVRVAGEAQADANRRAFIDAVRTAALQWEFTPLQISHWAADAEGNSHVVDSQARPFSLTYLFRFACTGGRASVSTRPGGA